MKKLLSSLVAFGLIIGAFAGCHGSTSPESKSTESEQQQSTEISKKVESSKVSEVPAQSNKVKIVVSNSILADMTKNVVGDKAEVYSIVPIGVDPHEYEPLPQDVEAVANADIIFYNGLNLETGGGGWFSKLMETAHKKEGEDYFIVSEGVKPFYLTTEGQENEQDPHAWLDLSNGIIYVNNIAHIMVEKDPENKEIYMQNASDYTKKLDELHNEAKRKFADIPADKKLLVSSEGAFKYFSAAYDVPAAYIWEINTESQGTPEQMTHIIDTIRETNITALFVETSIDPRSMEQVSAETGIPIYATIFTDSLAKEGEIGDNYYDMVKWNLDTIHAGLSGE